ncbi:hypothetical protein HUG15_20435 [Salicibibacter cibarius]|uniref:Rpn family recombination-promoting nuclease/putative transposase n=1 Tax=Salicibibacter cibarius TaxID=2743000 RepID=A0A7T6Z6A3_9BACI|nr:hypothetical protein [Salicibibacter cibarius]QQK77716.1 hypothetical protein HUG15_20435 [Salicibibacter cibarius]
MPKKKISEQNYDIIFKAMTEQFGQKALNFYGIYTAPILRVEPTDLPVIDVNERRMDFVFLLQDDTYLHLEFQTTFSINDLKRFKLYDTALYDKTGRNIYTYVIYGADITKADEHLDHGSIQYRANAIYMKDYDGDDIFRRLSYKVYHQETLDDDEQLQLVFLPLMHSKKKRTELATDVVELANQVKDEKQRFQLIGTTVGIADKFLEDSYVDKMMEVFKMTRIAQKVYEDGIEEGRQEGKEVIQEAILSYLESRFGLRSNDIQHKVKSIDEMDVLKSLIAKLYKTESEKQVLQLIDQALKND